MTTGIDASIIIPVYMRTEWLPKCLEMACSQDFAGTYEVIVADDGSPNSSVFKTLTGSFPGVKYIRNEHGGPAATRNVGAKHARGRFICFLDDDSIAERSWLSEIIEPFGRSDAAGLVNGRTLSHDRDDGLSLALEKYIYPRKNWATCNIAYRKDVFQRLGGFDETFKEPSWEDNDLGLRALWAGYEHVFAEDAVVYHSHEKSIDEYVKKCVLNGRGVRIFSRKYIGKKPMWSILTPLAMSRYLPLGLLPQAWLKKKNNSIYLKFLWSLYSLKGFLGMHE